ncbi:MAG TPA: PQQ-dependent sugar dehydrogenase [Candidatus Nanoarchaeia archaeon]|nr:PQQ-dependent sugar dehydrogenase [Candidatus Nanoarchaeia archaeon]
MKNNYKKINLKIGLSVLALAVFVTVIVMFSFRDVKISVSEENVSLGNVEVIAENLDIPWEIAFLPNNEMLVTERSGNLLHIGNDMKVIKIDGVKHVGEGGLLGLALHPKFESNNLIYLYFTSDINGKIENRVERYKLNLNANLLEDKMVILSGIPGAAFHDGGRIMFGPDGYLYITTGDAANEALSQDVNSLAGKILRVDENGSAPTDNPFGNAVYSYGHRNSQGLAWDEKGRLWSTEHGRSGLQSGFDELNLIEKGKNYGWPVVQGDEKAGNLVSPIIQSGADITWAPAGAVFLEDSILFTGLRGEALYEYDLNDKTLKEYFKGQFGRLRAIVLHNDFVYVSTSNKDGRGSARIGDDKILKIPAALFD